MTAWSLILWLSSFGAFFLGCYSSNCRGRKILNGHEGFISDGLGEYEANSHCEWLIDAGSANKTIHLEFESMATECSFDFLFIYDGKSYNSRLIATLSGDSPPKPVIAYSGYMLLYLFSDRNYLKQGFEARYKILDCPWNCSNRGQCINNTCQCRPGYSGAGCQEHTSSQSMPSTSAPPPIPPPAQPTIPSSPASALTSKAYRSTRWTPQKKSNTAQHKISQYERKIETLKRRKEKLKDEVEKQSKMKAHYSWKNVKKREERQKALRKSLREELTEYKALTKKSEVELERTRKELEEVKNSNKKMRRKIKFQEKRAKILMRQKRNAMKRARFHKIRNISKKKEDSGAATEDREGPTGEEKVVIETKNRLGEYNDKTRFCVMELAGLEVAMGKIGDVMETVGTFSGTTFSHLPSRFACQSIVDEGQVLAKSYIRENVLKRSKSFGLHKDGTTRKKVKILDTSIRTEEGDAYCLGWTSVVSETGQAIADEAKDKLSEVAGGSGQSMAEILRKLHYFMNDRAANEKKSSRLLEEWRKESLESYGEGDVGKIHHLYCAAHVLLGFHSYTINSFKKLDGNHDLKHPITLMLKDSSDIFGPVGDFRGLRNQWEAFCLDKGIKSQIKNYKDNRFNGLFEVSAQLFHHHQDFLFLLENQKAHNAKQTRLMKALQDKRLVLLAECLGVFFHKVTGPFWTMVTTSSLKKFQEIIPSLKSVLQKCSTSPNLLFDPESFSFLDFPVSSSETKSKLAVSIRSEEMRTLISTVSSALLATIQAQLGDFLEGGSYNTATMSQLPSAPLTNLICERHFGHLDASQRRRPNSSLHHHSSILLLKQTRKRLHRWYATMNEEEKEGLWRKARVEGKELRRKHRQQDMRAITESLSLKRCNLEVMSQICDDLVQGQMIAVACHDAWYPAEVKEESHGEEDVVVSFAELGKGLGSFRWPTGKDVHRVPRTSLVESQLDVEIRAGGRYWVVVNAKEVTNCPSDCGEHGLQCRFESYKLQYCNCSQGYVGEECTLQVDGREGQGQWYHVQQEKEKFPPRTSHTSVFLHNCLWVFGGFDLNNVLGDLQRYCMSENTWNRVVPGSKLQNSSWPSARSGHAMDVFGEGFFIFGGILSSGAHNNELWYFNVSSMSWSLAATQSREVPEKVTGHTLTVGDGFLYIVGGKTEERVFIDTMFRISARHPEQWERVLVKGGNYPPKRLVGHTTVYHKHLRSLIVFGGYTQGSALFSDRTREIQAFNIDDLYWSYLYNEDWRKDSVPRPRAFHSGVIMGNYLVVYGGNTHDHSGLEICYNQEIFFYHLGCHLWLNHTYFTGSDVSSGMPTKGRFGHSAAVVNGNVMFIIGGYSGQVLGDLIAYKVPSAIADFQCSSPGQFCSSEDKNDYDLDHCEEYPNVNPHLCQDDPECVFCNQGREDSANQSCVHRTRVELCVSGDFHDSTDRCPGICPSLHTCGACVSQGKGVDLSVTALRRRIHVQECSWCVKEAQCQTRAVPFGTCQAAEQTESGIQGWWGGLSANLTSLDQCVEEDFPAGLHWVKYKHPLNISFPDELSMLRKTKGTMGYTETQLIERAFIYTSKFLGFVHPLNAPPPPGEELTLFLGLMNAKAMLYLSQDSSEARKEKVISVGEQANYKTVEATRGSGMAVFPEVARGHKYFIEQVTEQTRGAPGSDMDTTEKTTITLGWNGGVQQMSKHHIITSEFLEPYSHGECSASYNCLGCLTDVLCSWCQVTRQCIPRNSSKDTCSDEHRQEYPITSPSECPGCENYVQCHTCASDALCEWVIENGHCSRRLRNENGVVTDSSKCRPPCHYRTNCSDCITEKGECAWCENTHTCLPFSDYVTRYIYGQCTSWVDSIEFNHGCHSCAAHSHCGTCLQEFGCGWCGNDHNPSVGLCLDGDFTGLYGNQSCSSLLSDAYNLPSPEAASWSYDQCPNIEECLLGLHDCHLNATCINLYASYRCECNRGFEGDGRMRCDETCYHDCVNGRCSGPPDFVCECELGWTSQSCDVDCGCNNHSTCTSGVGTCDECQHRTAGALCDQCQTGTYGNPLDPEGCLPCNCNGHGDLSHGECGNETGECFCTDNTEGIHCELCRHGYYGNPRNGGKCYLRCDHRVFVTNVKAGALGSYRGRGVENRGHTYCLWVLSVFSDVQYKAAETEVVPTMSLTMEGDMEIECGQDSVYVYEGIPEFVLGTRRGSSELLGAFCGINPGRDLTVYAKSGVIVVFFEGDLLRSMSRGFNATFQSYVCPDSCLSSRSCQNGHCVCQEGYWGQDCLVPICPFNCSENLGHGYCHNGICICRRGYGGTGCINRIRGNELVVQVLSNSWLMDTVAMTSPQQDFVPPDAFGPSPRVGHTLTTCGDGLIFLFGGFSQREGIVNDMWMYNVSAKLWVQVLPATEISPSGRYYHAAACIPLLKMIFVFGGFVATEVDMSTSVISVMPTNSLWKFNIESHAWTRDVSPPWLLPALAGHTLTHVGSTNLMLIGGFSSYSYFNDKVYEYNVSNGLMAWAEHTPRQMKGAIPIGLYGHSAVFNPAHQTIYVYGGYLFRSNRWFVSLELYTLDVQDREWNMMYPDMHSEWESRVFHTAAHVGDAMVVIGGLTVGGSYALDILVYRYGCNTWHRLQFDDFELEQQTTAVVGLDSVSLGDIIYIFGGFVGVAVGTLSQLTLPTDICSLITDPLTCSNISGCQMCVLTLETSENTTLCYDAHGKNSTKPAGCVGPSPEEKRCNLRNHRRRKCQRYTTCSQCLATHPEFKEQGPSCIWCTNCPTGRCAPKDEACPTEKPCPLTQHTIETVSECYEYMCPASDCVKCGKLGHCLWTRHFKRSSEIGRYFSQLPVYDWNCVTVSLKPSTTSKFESMPPEVCPARCYTHTTCQDCLDSPGSEGGSKECLWSETLQECMPPAYLPLRCSLGECGFLRTKSRFTSCPIPCKVHKKCADCIASPSCGWCAFGGMNGQGVCMPGGTDGPTQGVCSEGNVSVNIPFVDIIAEVKGKPEVLSSHTAHPIWSFDKCQPENECQNQHHTCNPDTQDCYDTLEHFRCECKRGYVMNAGTNNCEPVCHQGCVHGSCVKPDDCRCHFGWVGSNCSVECMCNRHSNCKSVTENKVCVQCENNTMGERCQNCRPMFVGNPENGGRCMPCYEFCHNHTTVCMTQHEYDLSLFDSFETHSQHNRHSPFYHLVQKGPLKEDAVCINCQHNTTGDNCDKCTSGHFRKFNEPKSRPCRKCHCNGHGNTCSPDTGESCSCSNNTETNCEAKDEAECWEIQCAQCKEYFMGTPTDGHQCYRQMTVDRDYCFDPDTQKNCNQFPMALRMGQTAFFAVQPKYLNVDIRITIDVTMGSADVFISNKKDTFQVFVDKSSWQHNIYLDKMYASSRAGLARRSILGDSTYYDDEAIRRKLQLHESGSVLVTSSVPDYLKLKATDSEFYKLTQFESMEKSSSGVIAENKGKGRRNGTSEKTGGRSFSNNVEVKEKEVRKVRKGKGKMKGKKTGKSNKRFEDILRRRIDMLPGRDKHNFEHLLRFLDHIDEVSGLENESVLPPVYEDYLAKRSNKSTMASRPRPRRGLTVTDGKKDGGGTSAGGMKMGEIDAGDLNTYITVGQQNSVLVVRDVRFRLVVTLPRDQHKLKTSRFYIIVRSRGGNADNATYGNLYFRQDQPHIDLFVFFSVFFSCFFLFLAICVMLWKVKQTFDARRSRQMREREMECMASRPFARILVLVEHDEGPILPLPLGLIRRTSSRVTRYQGRNQYYNNNNMNTVSSLPAPRELGVVPIAIEPTEDGLASVGTVIFQLPGGVTAPSRLCLGSSLTTRINAHVPTQKSTNLRHRTTATSC